MEIKDKNLKSKEENKLIDDTSDNIKDILKCMEDNYKKIKDENINDDKYNTLVKTFKDFIDNINTDNNGNYSLNEKLKTIYKFTDLIKKGINSLYGYFIKDIKLKDNNEEKLKEMKI